MEPKKTRPQWLPLLLCGVLLLAVVLQGREIAALRRQLLDAQNSIGYQLQSLDRQMSSLVSQMREASTLVEDWGLTPSGVDPAARRVTAEVRLRLKEWREDTQVYLTVAQGSNTQIIAMTGDGAGGFSAPAAFSGENGEIRFQAGVNTGGTQRAEELGSWSDFSMLLPLQNRGCGYSTPIYANGVLTYLDWPTVTLDSENGGIPQDAEFRCYLNNALMKTHPGAPLEQEGDSNTFTAGNPETAESWSMECQEGDVVAFTFFCRDQYGLGYEFPIIRWRISEDQTASEINGGNSNVALIWE